jgi:DNA polymerase III alpha subunit
MDIDIDFADRTKALALFEHVRASRLEDARLVPHNTGVYFHTVPLNAASNLCAIPYEQSEAKGYFKIDFLNVSLYKDIKDEAHLIRLMEQEPDWVLFEHQEIVDSLFHINGHFDVVKKVKPKSVEQLAAVLAMIRPAKRYLIGKDWQTVLNEVWQKPKHEHQYYFKHAHAIAYAVAIVVQLNLIIEQTLVLGSTN